MINNSKGYTCRKQNQIQSKCFDIAKVSLHVTILYHHAVEVVDGIAAALWLLLHLRIQFMISNFQLLKVTSKGVEELEEPLTNDYSCHYPRGSDVLKEDFCLRENVHDTTYTFDTKRVAVLNAARIHYICFELKADSKKKTIYKFSLVEHEEIIAST